MLDELESHLREEFDRLVASGKAQTDAWDQATRKLGHPQKLAHEFAKLRRPHWLPAWIGSAALAICIGLVTWFVFARVTSGRFSVLLASHVVLITAGYTAVFAIGFMGICAAILRAVAGWNDRQDAAFCHAGARLALLAMIATFIGSVLGARWARDHLGRWWGWDARELGGVCVLTWSFLLWQAFRATEAPPQSRLFLAVMANVVVSVAWFGHMLTDGGQSYGSATMPVGIFLGAFLIMQMLLVYLTLLPAEALGSLRRALH